MATLEKVVRQTPCFRVTVVKLPPRIVAARRAELTRGMRSDYRRLWNATSGEDIHHVLPLCIGGTNNPKNLALVEDKLHTAIHEFLDEQMRGMGVGDRRELKIPCMPGRHWAAPPERPSWNTPRSYSSSSWQPTAFGAAS